MHDWADLSRMIQGWVKKQIRDALKGRGINERTIDADVLRGVIDSSVVLPAHAATHHSGGTDPLALGSIAGTINDTQHGNRGGGALHADVVAGGASGFMTGAQATKLAGIAAGASVTSVALSAPSQFSVTGSPITSAGTLALAWVAQAANRVLAGPASGADAVPAFRTLVSDDIPTLAASKITNTAAVLGADNTFTGNQIVQRSQPSFILDETGASNPRFLWRVTGTTRAQALWNEAGSSFNVGALLATGIMTLLAGGSERMRLDANGNVVVNTGGLATTATDGFLYIPSCAGTPTGAPTGYSNRVPLVYDRTNNILYAYAGGAWRAH